MFEKSPVLSVSRLARLIQDLVEENFMQIRVEGEISNWTLAGSGHAYFTLKDEQAQIRCAMFRPAMRALAFRPENGMQAVLGGRLSFYGRRGDVQLVAENLEPKGLGGLQLAFEQLKSRLAAEGLFDEAKKRPLPPHPRVLGLVTSPRGAALQDILQILRRRACGLRVILAPVRVQGEGAAEEIASGIRNLCEQGTVDVIILGRGGGSLEDLWAFNEEILARAIRASNVPVIAAVGHETDFSIADFAADLRAPTPSAAAELVVRSRQELEEHLDHLSLRLGAQIRHRLSLWSRHLEGLRKRLRCPRAKLAQDRRQLESLRRRLELAASGQFRAGRTRLAGLSGRLHALSPLRTLERGYAIALTPEGAAVRESAELHRGQRLRLRFFRGEADVRVEDLH